MRRSNFNIALVTMHKMVLRDLGPWDQFMTITNNVEDVVQLILPMLKGRQLFYWDSEGDYSEIVVENNRFARFAPAKDDA